ncbi:MAG TPA: helix-turn-helix domain-containing protein [Solirubrobacterales bacterium]|nr:helix-turn-helix domain-containing protein [Solirubrobacterales bacterium]
MPTQQHHSPNGHSQNGGSPAKQPETGQNGNGRSAVPVNWERLARATAHPLRVSILEILGIDGGRVLSPSDLSRELQIPLSNTNYHVTELAKAGLIELVRERQVRGATEHFYRLPEVGSEDGGSNGQPTADEEERTWAVA